MTTQAQQNTTSGEKLDPASMIVSPHEKTPEAPVSQPKIGGPGDPRSPSLLGFDTPQYGTETPYRKTPPTNWGSAAEEAETHTPPSTAAAAAALDAEPTSVNTVAPAVSGTVTVGQTLTCTPGTWVPAAASVTYQWYRYPDTVIAGATANTRVLAAGDSGFRIFCRVTGKTTTYGGSSPVNSNVVGPVP